MIIEWHIQTLGFSTFLASSLQFQRDGDPLHLLQNPIVWHGDVPGSDEFGRSDLDSEIMKNISVYKTLNQFFIKYFMHRNE